jgi:hypothetical protein
VSSRRLEDRRSPQQLIIQSRGAGRVQVWLPQQSAASRGDDEQALLAEDVDALGPIAGGA